MKERLRVQHLQNVPEFPLPGVRDLLQNVSGHIFLAERRQHSGTDRRLQKKGLRDRVMKRVPHRKFHCDSKDRLFFGFQKSTFYKRASSAVLLFQRLDDALYSFILVGAFRREGFFLHSQEHGRDQNPSQFETLHHQPPSISSVDA
jgi:hypothetical protein